MKKFIGPILIGTLFVLSQFSSGCDGGVTEHRARGTTGTAEEVRPPYIAFSSGGCLEGLQNPSTVQQNCYSYAVMRMMHRNGQYCGYPYNQNIESPSNGCTEKQWEGVFSGQSAFYNAVSVGDIVTVGSGHVVYVVSKSGSSLSSIVVDDANRTPGAGIVHGSTLAAVCSDLNAYPTQVWGYKSTSPTGSDCTMPDPTALVSPAEGVTLPLTDLSFVWTKSWPSNNTYRLQISTDPNFATFEVNVGGLSDTVRNFVDVEQSGALYYWRVIAENSNGGSPSVSRSFSTIGAVTMPAANSIYEANVSIEMQWTGTLPSSTPVDISFSSNGGANWTLKQSNVPFGSGSGGNTYMLSNPGVVSTNAKVKVSRTSAPTYSVTSETFITGPSLSVSGPTSLPYPSEQKTWTVSATPSGSYTYQWHRKNWGESSYTYVGAGTSYAGYQVNKGFTLRVDAYQGSVKIGTTSYYVSCSNCGLEW